VLATLDLSLGQSQSYADLLHRTGGTMRSLSLNEDMEIPITWTWYLQHFLINLVFWLLLFGALLLYAYYLNEVTSLLPEQ
jgi:hypothetical protein